MCVCNKNLYRKAYALCALGLKAARLSRKRLGYAFSVLKHWFIYIAKTFCYDRDHL
ncbi:hypothetical protein RchiOBHm_Chr5g0063041 [Rosa chinensis]|uniref:Uncharacterized protein n=1 Tax=Rosa chinensis TaxID=74649 RepID=A0A2P6QIB8_ROSCH|nr:hypothetical protein RchiOBHm_Chr5g0063041 [Rosa chinensis]